MDRIRVLMTKLGLDSHYRGAMVVSRYLIDSGMEVIYAGNLLPAQTVRAALQEDVDVVGISSLSGNHLVMVPPVVDGLRAAGAGDVVVVVGGIVPSAHADRLLAGGVSAVFGPGAELADVAGGIRQAVRRARAVSAG